MTYSAQRQYNQFSYKIFYFLIFLLSMSWVKANSKKTQIKQLNNLKYYNNFLTGISKEGEEERN